MPEQQKQQPKLSPVSVWGKVITQLRTMNKGALFIACGEIDDVSIKDNTFIIKAKENNKLLLDVPENFKILQEIMHDLLPNYDILVTELRKEDDPREIAKEKLKQLFGDKLNILGEIKLWR